MATVARAPRPRWKRPSSFVVVVALALLIYYMLFFTAPFIAALVIGFLNWDLLSTVVPVGFDNYVAMADDRTFKNALKVSAIFVGAYVPIALSAQLILGAILANMRTLPQKVYLTLFFLPVVTPWLIAVLMFGYLFNTQAGLPGMLNEIFGALGIDTSFANPLGSKDTALLGIMGMTGWKFLGFGALIFLVGINEIPLTLYEAAKIDGAGAVRQFRHITWPLIRPIMLALSITSFIGALQIFDPFFVMTRGGPGDATNVFSLYLYRQAFDQFRFGYASAMAMVMFLILLILSVSQLAIARTRWEY